ncbi:hypothetical protein VSP10_13780 [Myroides odoratimimus]|uniref:hypothetical protein n=1 Tax=Myroides odoratimimus TaxID=76832 RepID=UPI002DBAC634|nr:hypothetical protein [Myroides odoratimimus]MEC4053852.1 hypothetical protein [Myroides odoratimimus]
MAVITYCESCSTPQPVDYQPGDICVACAGSVRVDVRCGWCVSLTPAQGNFCRGCGSKLVEEKHFGVARILKSLGYNQEQIPEKIHQLSEGEVTKYNDEFYKNYRVIQYAKEQLQLLEPYLLLPINEAVIAMETDLLNYIPYSKQILDEYEDLLSEPASLDSLLKEETYGIHRIVRQLVNLVQLKQYPLDEQVNKNIHLKWADLTTVFEYEFVRIEGFLWFAHPNSFQGNFKVDQAFEHLIQCTSEKDLIEVYDKLTDRLKDTNRLKPYLDVARLHLYSFLNRIEEQEPTRLFDAISAYTTHTDYDLAMSSALIIDNQISLASLTAKNRGAATTGYYYLLYYGEEYLMLQSLQESGLNYYQFKGLLQFVKYNKYLQDQGNTDVYTRQIVVNEAISLLLKKFNSHVVFDRHTDTFSDNELHSWVDLISLYDNTEVELDYSGFVSLLINRNLRHALIQLLEEAPAHLVFTDELAKELYLVGNEFDNTLDGFNLIAGWSKVCELGYFPSEDIVDRMLLFIDDNYKNYTSSEEENAIRLMVLNVLSVLVQESSRHSYKVVVKLIKLLLINEDTSNTWLPNEELKNSVLSSHYYVKIHDDSFEYRPFATTDIFITDFFRGDWHAFTKALTTSLSIGKRYDTSPYSILLFWISQSGHYFADVLTKDMTLSQSISEVLIESLIALDQGEELLCLQDSDKQYPLLEVLFNDSWDYRQVYYYSRRPDNLPIELEYKMHVAFVSWLSLDIEEKLLSELFQKIIIVQFQQKPSGQLPICLLTLWFIYSDRINYKPFVSQSITLLFENIEIGPYERKLPKLLTAKGVNQEVEGREILQTVFYNTDQWLDWLDNRTTTGSINEPIHQFMLLVLLDFGSDLEAFIQAPRITTDDLEIPTEEQHKSNRSILFGYLKQMVVTLDTIEEVKFRSLYAKKILKIVEDFYYEDNLEDCIDIVTLVNDSCDDLNDECDQVEITLRIDKSTINWFTLHTGYMALEDYLLSEGKHERWVGKLLKDYRKDAFKVMTSDALTSEQVSVLADLLLRCLGKEHWMVDISYQTEKVFRLVVDNLGDMLEELPPEKFDPDFVIYIDNFIQKNSYWSNYLDRLAVAVRELKRYYFEDVEQQEDWSYGDQQQEQDQESISQVVVDEDQQYSSDQEEQDPATVLSDVEIAGVMMSFSIDKENLLMISNHFNDYTRSAIDNPIVFSPILTNVVGVKEFLAVNVDLAIEFYQKLYMIVLDPQTAPSGIYPSIGAMARMVFAQLLHGTMYSGAYAIGVEAMVQSGVYTADYSQALNVLVNQLKA